MYLERDHARLLSSLEGSGIHVPADAMHALSKTTQWRDFPHGADNEAVSIVYQTSLNATLIPRDPAKAVEERQ